MFRQLLDRVAAIEQDALIAIDIGDGAFAGRGGVKLPSSEWILRISATAGPMLPDSTGKVADLLS
jgi:hypothetical protein